MDKIHISAADLRTGDTLRDSGMRRKIEHVEHGADVLVHFEADVTRPDAHSQLSMPAAQSVTAWRTT